MRPHLFLLTVLALGLCSPGCTNSQASAPTSAPRVVRASEPKNIKTVGQFLQVGDKQRHFTAVAPKNARGPLPVIIALHGRGGAGAGMITEIEGDRLAEQHGVLVIAPDAIGGRWWEFKGRGLFEDDLAFIKTLVEGVGKMGGDPKRVYLVGFSNGGGLAFAMGSYLSKEVAAVCAGGASVATLGEDMKFYEQPKPERPISVLMVHGKNDGTTSYDTIDSFSMPVTEAAAWWAEADGLPTTPKRTVTGHDLVWKDVFGTEGADTEVQLWTYTTGVHQWPNVLDGDTGMDFTEEMWTFLSRHHL